MVVRKITVKACFNSGSTFDNEDTFKEFEVSGLDDFQKRINGIPFRVEYIQDGITYVTILDNDFDKAVEMFKSNLQQKIKDFKESFLKRNPYKDYETK